MDGLVRFARPPLVLAYVCWCMLCVLRRSMAKRPAVSVLPARALFVCACVDLCARVWVSVCFVRFGVPVQNGHPCLSSCVSYAHPPLVRGESVCVCVCVCARVARACVHVRARVVARASVARAHVCMHIRGYA